MSKRVCFSPDVHDLPPPFQKHGSGTKVGRSKKRVTGVWTFRLPKSSGFSPVVFLRRAGAKLVRTLRFMSARRRCSRRVSSSSLTRSRSYADTIDSHRAEAVEDCIEFLNSSSSLHRSN
ncbi:hypothetical protein NMG60_11000232 [Bertholletia excelsa]